MIYDLLAAAGTGGKTEGNMLDFINTFLICAFLRPSFTWPLSIIYDTQFQTKKMYLKTYESIIVS